MFTPSKVFGSALTRIRDFQPEVLGTCAIAEFKIEPLRYDFVNFESEDVLHLAGDWFLVYRVSATDRVEHLLQQDSVFYTPESEPPPDDVLETLDQGDGKTSPRWHKCDRSWPKRGGQRFEFVGQSYYDSEVVYLFKSLQDSALAIFCDDVKRQDAEEHYREEEERFRNS